jgi:hypothetical protein
MKGGFHQTMFWMQKFQENQEILRSIRSVVWCEKKLIEKWIGVKMFGVTSMEPMELIILVQSVQFGI